MRNHRCAAPRFTAMFRTDGIRTFFLGVMSAVERIAFELLSSSPARLVYSTVMRRKKAIFASPWSPASHQPEEKTNPDREIQTPDTLANTGLALFPC